MPNHRPSRCVDREGGQGASRAQRAIGWSTSAPLLEIHDGLQIDVPGKDRPFGCAVAAFCAGWAVRPRSSACRLARCVCCCHPTTRTFQLMHRFIVRPPQAVKRSFPVDTLRPGVHRNRKTMEVRIRLEPDSLQISGSSSQPQWASCGPRSVCRAPSQRLGQPEGFDSCRARGV